MQPPENFGQRSEQVPPQTGTAQTPATPSYGQGQPLGQPMQAYPSQPYQTPSYGSPLPSPTGSFEGARVAGKRVLKRIDVGSAFKVGAVTYALMWAVLGLPFMLLMSVAGSFARAAGGSGGAGFAGAGIFGYLIGIAVYGLMGGIGSAVAAFVYNLVSGWMGGLEIEVE
jgi:hypothetical protein